MQKIPPGALEKIKRPDGSIPLIKNFQQYIIWKFLKDPSIMDNKRWAQETKLAKIIQRKFPLINIGYDVDLGFKLNSLAWFLTPDGKKMLSEKQRHIVNMREFLKNKSVFTSEENHPTAVMDFIKNKQ